MGQDVSVTSFQAAEVRCVAKPVLISKEHSRVRDEQSGPGQMASKIPDPQMVPLGFLLDKPGGST